MPERSPRARTGTTGLREVQVAACCRRDAAGEAKEAVRLRIVPGAPDGEGIPATVEIAEPLGHEVLLGLKVGDRELVARVAPDVAASAGDRVLVQPDPARLHRFDAATGVRIE